MFGDGAENRRVSAIFRLRDGGDLGYIVTCIKDNDGYYGFGDYIYVGVCTEFGECYVVQNMHFLGDYFEPKTWYHLKAGIYGHPYFTYNVSLDSSFNFSDGIYPDDNFVEDGLPGIRSSVFAAEQSDIYIDNFEVNDNPTSIESKSLGEIKASFK